MPGAASSGRGKEGAPPGNVEGSEGRAHILIGDSWPPKLTEYIPIVLSHRICGKVLPQLWETPAPGDSDRLILATEEKACRRLSSGGVGGGAGRGAWA